MAGLLLYVVLRRAFHRRFQSSRFSRHLASSLVVWAPASFHVTSTYVNEGRPLDRWPRVGSQSTNLNENWMKKFSSSLRNATFLESTRCLRAEAAVISVSRFRSDVTSGWRRLDPICTIPCASCFLWSESDLLQRRKMGTCRKNNLIKSTFPIWALTHPVTERERKGVWRGCWISCSSFPLRNVIESPPSFLILWAKISDMASSAKCLLKWLYVPAAFCWSADHSACWCLNDSHKKQFTQCSRVVAGKPLPQKDCCCFLVKACKSSECNVPRLDESYALMPSFSCELPWRPKFHSWQVKDTT